MNLVANLTRSFMLQITHPQYYSRISISDVVNYHPTWTRLQVESNVVILEEQILAQT